MATPLNISRDEGGAVTYIIPFSDEMYDVELAVGAEQTLEVPLIERSPIKAIFSYERGTDVFVAINQTATLPTGTFAKTNSSLNPTGRVVKAGDVLHFITRNTTADVGIEFYV